MSTLRPAPSPTSSVSSQNTTPTSPHFRQYAQSTRSLVIQHPRPPTPPLLRAPGTSSYNAYLGTWGDTEVATFLGFYRCGQYAGAFARHHITGKVLLDLDMAALKEVGISKVGERVKLLSGIKDLRKRASASNSNIVSLRLNGAATPTLNDRGPISPADHILPPQDRGMKRLHNTRPPPLDLHASRPVPISESSTPRPTRPPTVPGPSRSTSTLRPPPARAERRSPSPVNADAASFADRPLPPAPSHSSAAEYASAVTRDRSTPTESSRMESRLDSGRSESKITPDGRMTTRVDHRKNPSLSSSPIKTKLPGRPATREGTVHPFARREESPAGSGFDAAPSTGSTIQSHRRNPSNVKVTDAKPDPRARKDQSQLPLEDIRRQVVKFINKDDGTTRTVNVASCSSGVEVLERVLKKFGKWNTGASVSTDGESDEDGDKLEVDGWGVYAESDPDEDAKPLSEASLLGICLSHRDGSVIREKGLVLRRARKPQYRKKMEEIFGETPPPPMSPTSPTYGPRFGSKDNLLTPSRASGRKKLNRASTVSVMSGLGVAMPDTAPEPPTRSPSSGSFLANKGRKMYNFFGHRPPSELIANHLGEYFPAAKKRELQRHSMLRMSKVSSGRGSFETMDRRSIIDSSPRRHMVIPEEGEVSVPRVSVSNDSGANIPPQIDDPSRPPLLPPFEPSSESLSDSLGAYSPTAEKITTERPLRPKSIMLNSRRGSTGSNKSRMSTLSQLRRNRDRSDTASLLTVDEITAEVENRRASTITFDESDDEDITGGSVPPPVEPGLAPKNDESDSEEGDDEEEDDSESESESESEGESDASESSDDHGKAYTSTGSRIFKWIKGALIGAGSFGSVYLGMDAQSGLLMAVKQVELPTGSARNEERKKSMVDALEREIELLKELQHDNIVQYLDSSSDGNHLNIFLEYVPGGSVAALLNNYGAFEEALVRNFVRQILTGLNYLHEREIIHRDIKGANILVDNKGGIKISDFGISKKVENNLMTGMRTHRPSLQGSVFWMAPEIVKQTSYTSKADIWSVGCLVVEMLTGTHPWAELTQMQAIFRIGSSARPATPSDISPEAADFLNKSFEIDHNARPTAAQLLDHPFISPRNAPMISAQQAKNAMAQATKQREMMGMQSLSALAEVK